MQKGVIVGQTANGPFVFGHPRVVALPQRRPKLLHEVIDDPVQQIGCGKENVNTLCANKTLLKINKIKKTHKSNLWPKTPCDSCLGSSFPKSFLAL